MSEQLVDATITQNPSAMVFTYGLCANALLVVNSVGLIELLKTRPVHEDELYDNEIYPNAVAIKGALIVLHYGQIVSKQNKSYVLTDFGKTVIKDMPSFLHWFESYSKLLGKSVDIALDKEKVEVGDFSFEHVAFTGALVKDQFLPVLSEVLEETGINGSFCDLGCGTAESLIHVCHNFQVPGIGFAKSQEIVDLANKNISWEFKDSDLYVNAFFADVTDLKGIYPEVDILYTNFITHHFASDEFCTDVLRSYQTKFPNARYLIIIDGVTPTDEPLSPQIFAPAFDYIHRLDRLETRSKESLDKIIENTGYQLTREIAIEFPNHYMWVLNMKDE